MQQIQQQVCLGIRREQFSKWERRCALPPKYCQELLTKMPDLKIKVQPSNVRVFTDSEFLQAGCEISEDLSDCDVILGVKQVPNEHLIPNKTFIFFSHVIKAQAQNMKMLDEILSLKITLLDYEKICDQNGQRLVAFGKFAGISGAVDILHGLGNFLLNRSLATPFINIAQSYSYQNVQDSYESLRRVGEKIKTQGLPKELCPFIVGVTGTGRSASGAIEVYQQLPHEMVEPEQLEELFKQSLLSPEDYQSKIYIVNFRQQHMVAHKDPNVTFNKNDYYENPSIYKGIFQEKFLPYLSVLTNCIYWEDKYCRLIRKDKLKTQYANGLRLLAISDITCDFKGSIDFLDKFSTIDNPFLVYRPDLGQWEEDYKKSQQGILYDSIENMPTQFPVDASEYFGKCLMPFLPDLLRAKKDKTFEEIGLPMELANSCITHNGHLTDKFLYIQKLRDLREEKESRDQEVKAYRKLSTEEGMSLDLQGHLFDTKSLHKILDILMDQGCVFSVTNWSLGHGSKKESSCTISIKKIKNLQDLLKSITSICQENQIQLKQHGAEQCYNNIYNGNQKTKRVPQRRF